MSLHSRLVRAGGPAALTILLLATPAAMGQVSIQGPPAPPTGGAVDGGGGTRNVAPVISSITAVQVAGQKFRIYGKVTDDTPATCGVTLSGATSGVVQCDASGNFDGVFDVATPGPATAVASDGQLQSAAVNLNLGNAAPTITMTITHGPNGAVTFSGKVTDEVPTGLVVTLTGGPGVSGSAIVLADGSWSTTITLAEGATGTATATVTDWYGLTGTATGGY
jgi:hypothetical protein